MYDTIDCPKEFEQNVFRIMISNIYFMMGALETHNFSSNVLLIISCAFASQNICSFF